MIFYKEKKDKARQCTFIAYPFPLSSLEGEKWEDNRNMRTTMRRKEGAA